MYKRIATTEPDDSSNQKRLDLMRTNSVDFIRRVLEDPCLSRKLEEVKDLTMPKAFFEEYPDQRFLKSTYIFKPKRVDGVNVIDTITLSHTFNL